MSRILIVLFGVICAIVVILLVGWLLWWLWKRREGEEAAPTARTEEAPLPSWEERAPAESSLAFEAAPAELPPDDLTRIEGIGPRIAEVLREAGIRTFAQLAALQPGQIEQILEQADPRLRRLADPTTWPEQAALAAEDRWEELAELQEQLKGGRSVGD